MCSADRAGVRHRHLPSRRTGRTSHPVRRARSCERALQRVVHRSWPHQPDRTFRHRVNRVAAARTGGSASHHATQASARTGRIAITTRADISSARDAAIMTRRWSSRRTAPASAPTAWWSVSHRVLTAPRRPARGTSTSVAEAAPRVGANGQGRSSSPGSPRPHLPVASVLAVGLGAAPTNGTPSEIRKCGRRRGTRTDRRPRPHATTLSVLDLGARRRRLLPRRLHLHRVQSAKSAPEGPGAQARRAVVTAAARQGSQGSPDPFRPRSPRQSPPHATSSTPRRATSTRAEFADRAEALGERGRSEVEMLDEKALAKGGYGGILGVGKGSSRQPRLVRLAYAPEEARPRRSRWSARASRSTPAASRSSRPRAWRT